MYITALALTALFLPFTSVSAMPPKKGRPPEPHYPNKRGPDHARLEERLERLQALEQQRAANLAASLAQAQAQREIDIQARARSNARAAAARSASKSKLQARRDAEKRRKARNMAAVAAGRARKKGGTGDCTTEQEFRTSDGATTAAAKKVDARRMARRDKAAPKK